MQLLNTLDLRQNETTFFSRLALRFFLRSQFEQVLQNGRVPDAALTDRLDQSAPPAEAVQRPQGNELDEEGPTDHVPRKQIRVEAKTEGLDNPDEAVFTIREEKDHESWRQFSPTTRIETTARTLAFCQKRCLSREHGCSTLSFPVFEDDVFPCKHGRHRICEHSVCRRKTTETSHCKMTEEDGS